MSFTLKFNSSVIIQNPLSGCNWTAVVGTNNTQYTTTGTPTSLTGFDNQTWTSNLTQVLNIPTTVTSIGNFAFGGCSVLTSVTFSSNSTLKFIDVLAFYNCNSLQTINIPASVTSIGSSCFQQCTSLTSVTFSSNSTLNSITSGTFNRCTSLQTINIPASVTYIGSSTFERCTSLTSVTFSSNSTLKYIDGYTFYNCYSLQTINIPASVTSIGNYDFLSCTSLTSVTVSSTQYVNTSTTAFQNIGTPNTLYTTAANYPPNNLPLTNQFTNVYLIDTTIPTNYTTIQSGQRKDLSNIFYPLVGTPGSSTGYVVTNYNNTGVSKDLNQIFEPYTTGRQAEATGIKVNGIDLNQKFKPL